MNAVPPDLTGPETVLGDWSVPRTANMVSAVRHDIRMVTAMVIGPSDLNHDVETMAGELLANAVEHGSGDNTQVRVSTIGRMLRVEVFDAGTGPLPQHQTDEPLAEHGRGLTIVAALASRWHLERTKTGTRAWFEVQQPASATDSDTGRRFNKHEAPAAPQNPHGPLAQLRVALLQRSPHIAAYVCIPNAELGTPAAHGWYLRVISAQQGPHRIVVDADEQVFRWDSGPNIEMDLGPVDQVEQAVEAIARALGVNVLVSADKDNDTEPDLLDDAQQAQEPTEADTDISPHCEDLPHAIQVVCGAYEEAMRRYGLLPGTIRVVSRTAELLMVSTLTSPAPQEVGFPLDPCRDDG